MQSRAELQRRLAAEFERRGWEYDLSVGPAVVDEALRTGSTDPAVLAAIVSSDYLRRMRATTSDMVNAISAAFREVDLTSRQEELGMRLLFVSASPENEVRLRLDAEHRDIRNRVRSATARDQVSIELASAARATDLIDELNRARPTILHLAGHGGPTGIALEDEAGNVVEVTTARLERLVASADEGLRLVVLNSCDSAHHARPLTGEVEAAIGMTRAIGDDAARVFAAQLYSSLAEALPLDRAFEQARLQVSLAGIPEDATPSLYLRPGVEASAMRFVT